jgi:hypothetical protein
MNSTNGCQCSSCKRKEAAAGLGARKSSGANAKPREQWGANAHGEWKQQNTYYPQFAEQRWERRQERRDTGNGDR